MSITKLTENLNIIQALPDSPTQGAQELKAKFDEASNIIKTYINEILTKEIDELVKDIEDTVNSKILEDNKKKYYVGKIIIDTKNVNPNTYLGFGVWQLWGTGRVPVGVDTSQEEFDEVEKTGGEKEHTITINELPNHGHVVGYDIRKNATGLGDSYSLGSVSGGEIKENSIPTSNVGGGQPINIIQPYITCYMWKRVS